MKKEKFSREGALAECPTSLLPELTALFSMIDELDLLIELYEEKHGKRTKEIRASLLNKFSPEEICTMRERISHWN